MTYIDNFESFVGFLENIDQKHLSSKFLRLSSPTAFTTCSFLKIYSWNILLIVMKYSINSKFLPILKILCPLKYITHGTVKIKS